MLQMLLMALLARPFCTGDYGFVVCFLRLTTFCCYSLLTIVGLYSLVILLFSPLLGAGCVWNDILDREFDRQVGKGSTRLKSLHRTAADCRRAERTKHRPIADGRVSVQGALIFLAIHLVLLLALLWPLNTLAYVHCFWMSLS